MPAAEGVIPPDAVSRFTAAEARLYPMAMTDPVGYQRATALVGAVATELRAGSLCISDVLRRRQELIDRLPAIAQAASLTLDGLPADAIVDAASAVRCRELQAAHVVAEREARVQAARAAGDEWFVSQPDPAEVMSGTYRRAELHLLTGTVLITTVEAGGGTSGASYSIEVLAPTDDGASAAVRTYSSRDEWTAAADQIRAELGSGVCRQAPDP